MIEKKELRARIKAEIALMSDEAKVAESAAVLSRLERSNLFQNANNILIYWSLADEVRTHDCVKSWSATKNVYLPAIVGNDLSIRKYEGEESMIPDERFGIPEPVGAELKDLSNIDLVIVPGRAFDASGRRLGRGRGFYDRILGSISAPKVGVGFSCQLVDEVPTEPRDIALDYYISPNKSNLI